MITTAHGSASFSIRVDGTVRETEASRLSLHPMSTGVVSSVADENDTEIRPLTSDTIADLFPFLQQSMNFAKQVLPPDQGNPAATDSCEDDDVFYLDCH